MSNQWSHMQLSNTGHGMTCVQLANAVRCIVIYSAGQATPDAK